MNRDLRALARQLRPGRRRETEPWVEAAGWLVRHLPEVATVAVLVFVWQVAADHIGPVWTTVAVVVLVVVVVWWRPSRRVLLAVVGVRVTRHRLRAALVELRLTSHAGAVPVKLFIRPTPVGERVWLWLPVGVSAEDLADAAEHLRAACWARDVRVTRSPRWACLVAVDVIRRDRLGSARPIPAPVADLVSPATARKRRRAAA